MTMQMDFQLEEISEAGLCHSAHRKHFSFLYFGRSLKTPVLCLYAMLLSIGGIGQVDTTSVDSLLREAYLLRNTYPDSSYALLDQSLRYSKALPYEFGESVVYNVKGTLLRNEAEYDSALYYYNKSLDIRLALARYRAAATIFLNIGQVKRLQSDYAAALAYYQKALDLQEANQDSINLARTLQSIAALWDEQGEFEASRSNFERALMIYQLKKDTMGIGAMYNHLGILERNLDRLSAAIQAFQQSIRVKQQINDKSGLANSYDNLGNVFMDQQRLDSASRYFKDALELYTWLGQPKGIVRATLDLAEVRMAQNEPLSAIPLIQLAVDTCQKYHLHDDLAAAYLLSAYNHNQLNNFQLAYQQFMRYDSVNQLVWNAQKIRDLAEIQAKYELEKKDGQLLKKQSDLQARTIERNNLLFTLISILLIVLGGMIYFLLYTRNLKLQREQEAMKRKQEIGQLLSEQDQKVLDAEIQGQDEERKRISEELHDRVSAPLAAATIFLQAVEKSETISQIDELLKRASKDTREISHDLASEILTSFGLIPALQKMQKLITKKGQLEFSLLTPHFSERLSAEKELNLYRIVQILLSNTIEHANASTFSVSLERNDSTLILTVSDDGEGQDKSTVTQGRGLKNAYTRAGRIGGKFEWDSKPSKGTVATVVLDI